MITFIFDIHSTIYRERKRRNRSFFRNLRDHCPWWLGLDVVGRRSRGDDDVQYIFYVINGLRKSNELIFFSFKKEIIKIEIWDWEKSPNYILFSIFRVIFFLLSPRECLNFHCLIWNNLIFLIDSISYSSSLNNQISEIIIVI